MNVSESRPTDFGSSGTQNLNSINRSSALVPGVKRNLLGRELQRFLQGVGKNWMYRTAQTAHFQPVLPDVGDVEVSGPKRRSQSRDNVRARYSRPRFLSQFRSRGQNVGLSLRLGRFVSVSTMVSLSTVWSPLLGASTSLDHHCGTLCR